MKLSACLAAQLAHPRGRPGRLLGQAMDIANSRPLGLAVDALKPVPGERILDAGCGTGAALLALRKRGIVDLYAIDRSEAMIATARSRLKTAATLACGSIERPPAGWPLFDAILAVNVLYFADPAGEMIAALRRAMKPGGRLIAYVTDRSTMERWSFAKAGSHRLYDAQELQAALIEGGFAATSIWIEDHAVAPGVKGLIAHAER